MKNSNIKLSDWKAIEAIEDVLESFHSGALSDYDSLLKIKEILGSFGFIGNERA